MLQLPVRDSAASKEWVSSSAALAAAGIEENATEQASVARKAMMLGRS
jgi:hypothetical protein